MASGVSQSKRQAMIPGNSKQTLSKLQMFPPGILRLILSSLVWCPERMQASKVCVSFKAASKFLTEKGRQEEQRLLGLFKEAIAGSDPTQIQYLQYAARHIGQNISLHLKDHPYVRYCKFWPTNESYNMITNHNDGWLVLMNTWQSQGKRVYAPVVSLSGKVGSRTIWAPNKTSYAVMDHIIDMGNPNCFLNSGVIFKTDKGLISFHEQINNFLPYVFDDHTGIKRLRYMASILKAVDLLHTWKIVHGNLTPYKVFITGDFACVTDFCDSFVKKESPIYTNIPENEREKLYDRGTHVFQPLDYIQAITEATTEDERVAAYKLLADYPNDIWHLGMIFFSSSLSNFPAENAPRTETLEWAAHPMWPLRFFPNADFPLRDLITDMLAKKAADRPNIKKVINTYLSVVSTSLRVNFNTLDDLINYGV